MMPRAKYTKTIGTGITRYIVEGETFNPNEPGELLASIQQSIEFSRDPFRNHFSKQVEAAQERLKELLTDGKQKQLTSKSTRTRGGIATR